MVKPTTIQILIHLTVTYSWALRQLDVNDAFLHGTLIEDVFMQQPQGFRDPQFPQHVCKLQKAIYGISQTPHAWYTKLRNFLLSIGSSSPSLTAHSSSISKKSSLCSFLFMWTTSSSPTPPLNRSNCLLLPWLIVFPSKILVFWHTSLELKPYILPPTSSFLSTSTFVTY